MTAMNLEQSIEAILFWKGEPMTIKDLSKSLSTMDTDIFAALKTLEGHLESRGIVLLRKVDKGGVEEVMLGTSPDAHAFIEKLTKEEFSKDLGKASLETLSIILYKGPVKRSEIDYVRGVNSTFILRNLLIRGLIEKKPAPDDARASVYGPSFELLSHLGVTRVEELPNFNEVVGEIQRFKESQQESAGEVPSGEPRTEGAPPPDISYTSDAPTAPSSTNILSTEEHN